LATDLARRRGRINWKLLARLAAMIK